MQSPITFSLRQRAPAAAATRLDRLSIVNFITGAERTEQYFGSEIPSHRIASRRRRHSVRRTRQSAAINMYKSASRDRRRIVDDSSCSLATFHSTDEVITIRDSLSDHVAASSASAAVDRYVLHAPEPSCIPAARCCYCRSTRPKDERTGHPTVTLTLHRILWETTSISRPYWFDEGVFFITVKQINLHGIVICELYCSIVV